LHLVDLSAVVGILQNHLPALSVSQPPFLDFIQGSKAAKAGKVIPKAAISYAW
jgi:hypothetical protein